MTDYWVSWYNRTPLSQFELHSPWWVSGYTDDADVMVAAVRAESEEAAFAQVRAAYDNDPGPIDERFIELLPGSPFSGRFQQQAWMAWDAERTCGCGQHGAPGPEARNDG